MNKNGLLSSRSESQSELIESKYIPFCYSELQSYPFGSKLWLMVHDYKLEHLVKRIVLLC